MRSISKLFPTSLYSTSRSLFSSIKIPLAKLAPEDCHRLKPQQVLPSHSETSAEQLLSYYKTINIMRRLQVVSDNLYKARQIRGFCHLYNGQQAIPIGMQAALTYNDHIITAYRDHCQALARGDTPHQILAEQMGKRTGSSKGKGGSMHLYMRKNNYYGGNGIVGAQMPVGTGIAFGIKYEKKKEVCVTMYGDGAANQGQLFEAANMASLWELPIIYLCENNKYAMGTSNERSTKDLSYFSRIGSIPGIRASGMDIFSVKEVMKFAKKWCVQGKGPLFVEFSTYRYYGHSMSDPGSTYRTRDDVTEVRKTQDPILLLKNHILEQKAATEEDLKKIEKDVRAQIDKAVDQARNDPYPEETELFTNIYSKDGGFVRGVQYEKSQF